MQSSGGGRASARVRYRRAPSEDSEQPNARPDSDAEEESDSELAETTAAAGITPPSTSSASRSSAPASTSSKQQSAGWPSAAVDHLRQHPAVVTGVAVGVAATGGLLLLLSVLGKQKNSHHHAKTGKGKSTGAATTGPGPNSKVKPSATCVALADGSAVVVHRPIAADNSCLFNAVGYCMHHSTNRAPFLRQVVSREVSSDPQEYSAAFLGMENAAYCAWITNPAHWGGGIELAILAAHYRREIAAWNLATGACHVFGEERGFTKRVMVIYNGVHYDALAVSSSPRSAQEEDITEFNPRTKRGKMILAAAQKLVQLNRKGKVGHQEQLDKQKQEEKQQRKAKKQQQAQQQQQQPQQEQPQQGSNSSSTGSSKEQPVANGHAAAAAAAAPGGPAAVSNGNGSSVSEVQLLACQSCGEQLSGVDAARAHAAATGHMEFAEVE